MLRRQQLAPSLGCGLEEVDIVQRQFRASRHRLQGSNSQLATYFATNARDALDTVVAIQLQQAKLRLHEPLSGRRADDETMEQHRQNLLHAKNANSVPEQRENYG